MSDNRVKIVIVGGGFAGLAAALEFKDPKFQISLLDKRNFHLFQPLLYQIATGSLSPADIASPLRAVLAKQKNTTVYKTEVTDINPADKTVYSDIGEFSYDYLIIATGVTHNYFGNFQWAKHAPGLKTVEDSLEIRKRIFLAFEQAEQEHDPVLRDQLMRFVVIGSGPTGVELAGSLGELAHNTLKHDFRNIDPQQVEILLIEGFERILPPYPARLSAQAKRALEKLGVTIVTNTMVTDIQGDKVIVKSGEQERIIPTRTVLWAAGMKATPLTTIVAQKTASEQDRMGRILVNQDLSLSKFPEIFIAGDIANLKGSNGEILPGIAPVAMQQGRYIGGVVKGRLTGKLNHKPFKYLDKGNMAVIGRNAAVARSWKLEFSGYFAWLIWVFIHIWYLVDFDSKLQIMLRWAWNYWTDKRGARLITHEHEDKENSARCYEKSQP